MSKENVEIVRGLHAAIGTAAASGYFAPSVVVLNSPQSPDTAPYVGYEGLVAWDRDVRAAVHDFRIDVEEVIDVDESRVIVVALASGKGRASGLPAGNHLGTVFTLENRLIVKVQAYETKAEALEAVGLSE